MMLKATVLLVCAILLVLLAGDAQAVGYSAEKRMADVFDPERMQDVIIQNERRSADGSSREKRISDVVMGPCKRSADVSSREGRMDDVVIPCKRSADVSSREGRMNDVVIHNEK